MAKRSIGFFDNVGRYFSTSEEATISDLAATLGRVGDGDSLAPGIAKLLFQKRAEIDRIFAEHDSMIQKDIGSGSCQPKLEAVRNFVRAAP